MPTATVADVTGLAEDTVNDVLQVCEIKHVSLTLVTVSVAGVFPLRGLTVYHGVVPVTVNGMWVVPSLLATWTCATFAVGWKVTVDGLTCSVWAEAAPAKSSAAAMNRSVFLVS